MSIYGKTSFPVAAFLAPQSLAADASKTSAYVNVGDCDTVSTIVTCGDLANGKVKVEFLQAKDKDGGSAKALTSGGFAEKEINTAGTVTQLDGRPDGLDINGGFAFVAVKITAGANVGVGGAFVCVAVHKVDPDVKS